MTFKIEKSVPIFDGRGGFAGGSRYPFLDMEVGDSFEVKLGDTRAKGIKQLQSNVFTSGVAKLGKKSVCVRQNPEKDGVRVWRIA